MSEEPKKIAELVQRPLPWRRQKATLWDDRLELEVEGLFERYRIPFYLQSVKEEPDRVRVIPWLWLLFGAACLGGGAFLASWPLIALVELAGLATILMQLPRMRPRLVYTYRPLGSEGARARYEPHLYLSLDQPSRDEVTKFVEAIRAVQKRHIDKLKSEQEGEGGIAYARELERFAKLREREVLTEHEFAAVKAKLLNLRPRRIGF